MKRPNRFLTIIDLNGSAVESHLPDPGRLKELLIPGARVLLRPEQSKKRKTKYSTVAVYYQNTLVSLDTQLPNRWLRHLIDNQIIKSLIKWSVLKQEYKLENSRFDFHLKNNSDRMILEVKSVTMVEDGIALFPDAVTERGRRHLEHLTSMTKKGFQTGLLFAVQREDAGSVSPHWQRDPRFSRSLLDAFKAGVEISAIKGKVYPDKIVYQGELPVILKPDLISK